MSKRVLFTMAALLIGAGITISASARKAAAGTQGTWTGIVTDTMCGAGNTSSDCVAMCVKEHGAKYAFVESKSQKVYTLNPQNDAAPHAGHTVTVKGTLDDSTSTITATAITTQPSKSGDE
jgi:hypothetical protein